MNKIDIVYTWVDGSDPQWAIKKENNLKASSLYNGDLSSQAGKDRFCDNFELKYSLRSISLFAPWVNHIYIVTDQQKPSWLQEHAKITIVDHKDIIPENYLPTYNSSVIEAHLHNIPSLEEKFIYFNDDMFLGRTTSEKDFFSGDRPFIFTSSIFPKKKKSPKYVTYNTEAIQNSRLIVQENTNITVNYGLKHGIRPMIKSRLEYVSEAYKKHLENCYIEKFRLTPFSLLYLYAFNEISEHRAKTKYLQNAKETRRLKLFSEFFYVSDENIDNFAKHYNHIKPFVFCINDIAIPLNEIELFSSGFFSKKSPWEK